MLLQMINKKQKKNDNTENEKIVKPVVFSLLEMWLSVCGSLEAVVDVPARPDARLVSV